METVIPHSLLSLPAELRNMICDYVIPSVPLEYSRSLYVGIMYTCKQLRAEVEPKVLANMQEELDDIKRECLRRWNDLFTFPNPQKLYELENLVIQGRISFSKRCSKSRQPRTHRHHHIQRLLRMHFHTLTINIDCNHDAARPGTYCVIDTDWTTSHSLMREDQHLWPCLKNLSIDWSQALLCGVIGRKPAGGHVERVRRESLVWNIQIGKLADEEPVSFVFQRKDTTRSPLA